MKKIVISIERISAITCTIFASLRWLSFLKMSLGLHSILHGLRLYCVLSALTRQYLLSYVLKKVGKKIIVFFTFSGFPSILLLLLFPYLLMEILLPGATNKPQELDDDVLQRLVRLILSSKTCAEGY
jgi:hypothetical protein